MRIAYNDIDLGVIETYAFDAEAVFDDSGVDYLYTKYTVVVRAVFNGEVTANGPFASFTRDRGGGEDRDDAPRVGSPMEAVTPDLFPGGSVAAARPSRVVAVRSRPAPPGVTHAAVRHRLSTPRGQLYVFAGPGDQDAGVPGESAVVILMSPASLGLVCDCKNGPFPKVLGVHTALGDANTLLVDWSCETYVNESLVNGVSPAGALLSNRFAQTHLVDQDGYTTVVTGGVAVFRTDEVYRLNESPDARRPVLFMPIPRGFVRENIVVRGREDVTGVEYSYRDRQVPVNFPAGPYCRAASITAVHRQAITTGGNLFEGALAAYGNVQNIITNKRFAESLKDQRAKGHELVGKPAGPGSAIQSGETSGPPPGAVS
jgi:hypothetical protein